MESYISLLHADPTAWLLENDNPSVRYFTLRDLLGKPETNIEVRTARQGIMQIGPVPFILEKQKTGGYWEQPERFYTAKYKGTVWQLMILAELRADGNDDRIKKACDFILSHSQDRESGGFAYSSSMKKGGGRHSEVIPCLTGNMVWSLIRLGYLKDPRVQKGINWITTYQRYDDRVSEIPKGWPYDRLKTGCFGRHSCHMGAVKTLKALAEIPEKKRTPEVNKMIKTGAEYFLLHHVFKSSHNLTRVPKPGWLKFGFPLMYQTDALEILGILTRLGYKDQRMNEAVDLVVSKQNDQGRWILENTFNGRYQVTIEQKGKPSKWITLHALCMLKRFYSTEKKRNRTMED
ncbi:MAG: nitrogen fixation protein NifH [Candidatus Thermoplasmatota archaeon]|nr:nitrogen fixation protein NifH [Candidatus Thermoplasmatota archaeon]